MLWTIVSVFLILWLLGVTIGIGGNLIHLLLAAAVLGVIVNLVNRRRGAA